MFERVCLLGHDHHDLYLLPLVTRHVPRKIMRVDDTHIEANTPSNFSAKRKHWKKSSTPDRCVQCLSITSCGKRALTREPRNSKVLEHPPLPRTTHRHWSARRAGLGSRRKGVHRHPSRDKERQICQMSQRARLLGNFASGAVMVAQKKKDAKLTINMYNTEKQHNNTTCFKKLSSCCDAIVSERFWRLSLQRCEDC